MSVGGCGDAPTSDENVLQTLGNQRAVGDVKDPVTANLVELSLSRVGIVDVYRHTNLPDRVVEFPSGVHIFVGDFVQAFDAACLSDACESRGNQIGAFETGDVLLQELTSSRYLLRQFNRGAGQRKRVCRIDASLRRSIHVKVVWPHRVGEYLV